MHWPQITMIALMAMSFAVSALKHGEPRPNFNIMHWFVNAGLWVGLLYAGGFFNQQ